MLSLLELKGQVRRKESEISQRFPDALTWTQIDILSDAYQHRLTFQNHVGIQIHRYKKTTIITTDCSFLLYYISLYIIEFQLQNVRFTIHMQYVHVVRGKQW